MMDEQKLTESTEVAVPKTLDEDSNVAVLTKELQLVEPESVEGGALHKVFTTSEEILEAEAKDQEDATVTTERLIGEMTVPMTDDDLHENFHLRRCPKEHGIQRNVPEWDHEDAEAIERGVEAEEEGGSSSDAETADVGGVELDVLPGSNSRVSAETSQKTRSLRQTLRDTLRLKKKTKKSNEEVEKPETTTDPEPSTASVSCQLSPQIFTTMADVLKRPEDQKIGKDDKNNEVKKDKKMVESELSDEDKQLKDELNLLVERLQEEKEDLWLPSLETLRTLIKASTTSMTSVPKPLKFMREHFGTMETIYEKIRVLPVKQFCADIISVLGMTISEGRDCLHYKLLGSSDILIEEWGHEYLRHLAGEISQEWSDDSLKLEDDAKAALLGLAEQIIPYNLEHNAEAEACDLAMELEHLMFLEKFVDLDTYVRVCAYLTSCVAYVPDPENTKLLETSLSIYRKFEQWPLALRVAMQLNNPTLVSEIVQTCPDDSIRKQLAFMIGRQQILVDIQLPGGGEEVARLQAELNDITTNSLLNTNFLALGRELDILEPKTPEEVYKNLDGGRHAFGSQIDSARQNLASSFVSGFVNAGFSRDKLLTEDGNKWLYKNKEHGMLSATASLGLILLWDVDGGTKNARVVPMLRQLSQHIIKCMCSVGPQASRPQHTRLIDRRLRLKKEGVMAVNLLEWAKVFNARFFMNRLRIHELTILKVQGMAANVAGDYNNNLIRINLDMFKYLTEDDMLEILLHELVHMYCDKFLHQDEEEDGHGATFLGQAKRINKHNHNNLSFKYVIEVQNAYWAEAQHVLKLRRQKRLQKHH